MQYIDSKLSIQLYIKK